MSTKRCFLSVPSELRLHIYHYYFQLEGGYVYDAKSDKLKTSDGQPIDFSLMFTCRTIANEAMHLPLSVNTVTFSTLYREDWRNLAGCFNVVSTYYRHLEADLVLHLAEFMTPEMYGLFALIYPRFANGLETVSRNHRLHYADHNRRRATDVMYERWKGNRCCASLQSFFTDYVNMVVDPPRHQCYAGFSRAHRKRDSYSHPSNTSVGSDSLVQDALSYYLRLIADKKPVQFANHLHVIFPHWTGSDIVRDFLHLRFDNWAIPSESDVKNAIKLLDIAEIWGFPDNWHYEGPPPSPDEPFEHSSDEDDGDNGGDNGSNNGSDNEDGSDTDTYIPSGLHCREKIRFSAAANAIRFLKRIPGQRIWLKYLVLHEDFDSVNDPHTHARGLAAFAKENPSLQILRRVSLLDCIIGISYQPCTMMRILQRGERIELEPKWIRLSLSRKIGYWIRDALFVREVGIPTKCFTLRLEAGSHQDFCTDLLQRIVHRDVAWCRAYKLLEARGTFHHDEMSNFAFPRKMIRDEDVEAVDELANRTSGLLSADFNTGVPLDAHALADQTEHLHGYDWVTKWQLWDGSLGQQIPREVTMTSWLTLSSCGLMMANS
ncbi:hypothetical protein FMEXI_4979 [Fusarium mexicanum]|uniref:Uncharacterized protein n=1 Tax=Fusarium mexicanum TaxID=751941 RepID=A0A8H5MZA9_9HYPO|nr:hypothetical protein FMEXI_4979 [Fusarium mexicanum]